MRPTPATDSLRADHRQIEAHLDRLLEALRRLTACRVGQAGQSFEEIRRLARPHFQREEEVFYPQLRPRFPALLAQMDQQHQHTRQTEQYLDGPLASLDTPPSERDLVELHRLAIEFHDAVQVHIVDEEDHLLSLADRELSSDDQQRLFAQMQEVVRPESG